MNIREMENGKIAKRIKENENDFFSIFLSLELKDRFEKRPIEEKHLNFDQWRKIYMLRSEADIKKDTSEIRKEIRKMAKKEIKIPSKEIEISERIKNMSTKRLLNLRYGYLPVVDESEIYAELATRPHIPNKEERKER